MNFPCPPCPLCVAKEGRVFGNYPSSMPGLVGPEIYLRCAVCDLTYLDPASRLGPEAERERYALHDNRVADPRYREFLRPAVEAVHARVAAGAEGIDFGAGPGPAAAEMLRDLGHPVRLFDPFFHPNSEVLRHQYAFVLSTEAAEHFHRPGEEFARMRSLLAPGGVLVVMTSLLDPEIDFAQWYYRRDPTHVVFYSRRTVGWIAQNFEFVEVAILPPRVFVLTLPFIDRACPRIP